MFLAFEIVNSLSTASNSREYFWNGESWVVTEISVLKQF